MPWVRIDDHFDEHPKFEAAGPLAGWLFVVGLAYAGRNLTDGYIPARAVARLANWEGIGITVHQSELFGIGDDVSATSLAAHLVALGLWEVVEGGYQIHDYLHYQPSKAQVLAERERGRQRQASWRERNGSSNGTSNAGSNAVTNAGSAGGITMAPYPVPVPYPEDVKATDIKPEAREGDARAEARTATAAAAPPPPRAKKPRLLKPEGISFGPLLDAFKAAGLPEPQLVGAEIPAAQSLLKRGHAPELIVACWQDFASGEYPPDADGWEIPRLSFAMLERNQRFVNWLLWHQGQVAEVDEPRCTNCQVTFQPSAGQTKCVHCDKAGWFAAIRAAKGRAG